jgi:hypothetical protein
MASANVPGLAIAIIRDGQLFWRRGFGVKDKTTNQPVDNETVFEAASTSKPAALPRLQAVRARVMDLVRRSPHTPRAIPRERSG